jgi:predicted transcriptional regulator
MDKKLLELAVEIVQAQVALSKMSGEEIESVLIRVYNALYKMQQAEREGRFATLEGDGSGGSAAQSEAMEKIDPHSSIQEDKVICLECSAEFRQLTANHLKTHGLSPREYKRKWGFPLKQPLAARMLTKERSKSAKKRGLPEKLQRYLENKRQEKRMTGEEAGKPGSRRSVERGAA